MSMVKEIKPSNKSLNTLYMSYDIETTKVDYVEGDHNSIIAEKQAQVYAVGCCFNAKFYSRQNSPFPKKLIKQYIANKQMFVEISDRTKETISQMDNETIDSKKYEKMLGSKICMFYFIDIETFYSVLSYTERDIYLFAQNGSKFDHHFSMKGLLNLGYTLEDVKLSSVDNGVSITSTDERFPEAGEIRYTISGNKIYSLQIQNLANKFISIVDSKLQFNSSLQYKGKVIGIPKLDLSSGYEKDTLYSDINEFLNDGNEKEYLKRDCEICYTHTLLTYLLLLAKGTPLKDVGISAASIAFKE